MTQSRIWIHTQEHNTIYQPKITHYYKHKMNRLQTKNMPSAGEQICVGARRLIWAGLWGSVNNEIMTFVVL